MIDENNIGQKEGQKKKHCAQPKAKILSKIYKNGLCTSSFQCQNLVKRTFGNFSQIYNGSVSSYMIPKNLCIHLP